jgi:phenylacetate-coenzyme A ligase PaaK-like adenylate-forming protein
MLATPDLIQEAAQRCRLAKLLPRWLQRVPLYQNHPNGFSSADPCAIPTRLASLPFIAKKDIRHDFPRNFLGNDRELQALLDDNIIELEHTAGTSEERTPLLLPRGWWAEQELRALNLNAFVARFLEENPEAHRVTLTSPVCSSDIRYTGTPSRNDRIIGNTLFVNLSRYPFLWSETELDRMAAETAEWNPVFLDLDPVYGSLFALYCERQGIRFPSLKFIICSYEFLSTVHRRILQRAFGVPVFDLYGSTETGHLLMQTEHGEMRPSFDTAFLGIIDTDQSGVGDLVVTTLSNDIMPLVHYRIGDLAERREKPFGTRYVVHGRAADAFVTPSDRRVTTRQIDTHFEQVEGIVHYQVHQRGPDWLLRLVPQTEGHDVSTLSETVARLENLLETSGHIELEPTDLFVPEGSGKFRLGYPTSESQ